MEARGDLPKQADQGYSLESVLTFAVQEQAPIFGGEQRYLQFKDDSIRCFTQVGTGETVTEHWKFAGRTHSFDREVKKPVLVAEYAGLIELYHGVEAERQEYQEATREEREESYNQFAQAVGAALGPVPEEIDLEEPEELREFKAKTLPETSIVEAAKRIIEFREQSGVDEDAIICANCKGEGELHHDTCMFCQGGSFERRDMQGDILEKKDPDPPDPDCAACHGEGAHSNTCACCGGEGTISKYPVLTLVNEQTGQSAELTFDIAKLLAEGEISTRREVEEKAFENGRIDHSVKTWITLNDWLARQFTDLGMDPERTGMRVDGRFYEATHSLSFDLSASYDSWVRNADMPAMGIHAGEVRAFRKAHQTVGLISQGHRSETLNGEDVVISAQHQVADYVPQAFSQGMEKKKDQEVVLFELEPLGEIFAELKALVEGRGYTLGYSWYNGHSYNFYLMDEEDEITDLIESNHQSLRAAIENAKLKLTT